MHFRSQLTNYNTWFNIWITGIIILLVIPQIKTLKLFEFQIIIGRGSQYPMTLNALHKFLDKQQVMCVIFSHLPMIVERFGEWCMWMVSAWLASSKVEFFMWRWRPSSSSFTEEVNVSAVKRKEDTAWQELSNLVIWLCMYKSACARSHCHTWTHAHTP